MVPPTAMIVIALTGGVATGKSSVLARLKQVWGERAEFFSADTAVHDLLTTEVIKTKIKEAFGIRVFDDSGQIDRGQLREIVFQNDLLRRKLEGILHPEVEALAMDARATAEKHHKNYLVFEIPLLYEVESPVERHLEVVVGSSKTAQRQRLEEKRGIEPEMVEKIFQAQMPIEHKLARADRVIWNDGAESELNEQVWLLVDSLESQGR